jgi:hypothetical protein
MRAVYTTIFVKKQNRHSCINICFILVLTVYVSAPILGRHQTYNGTIHVKKKWIHIEIMGNSRTETSIIVRLMTTQYIGRNM